MRTSVKAIRGFIRTCQSDGNHLSAGQSNDHTKWHLLLVLHAISDMTNSARDMRLRARLTLPGAKLAGGLGVARYFSEGAFLAQMIEQVGSGSIAETIGVSPVAFHKGDRVGSHFHIFVRSYHPVECRSLTGFTGQCLFPARGTRTILVAPCQSLPNRSVGSAAFLTPEWRRSRRCRRTGPIDSLSPASISGR